MPKNKKRKKTVSKPEMGAYKHFLIDMHEAMQQMHISGGFSDLTNEFKRRAYNYKMGILNPTAGNESISSHELKIFAERAKRDYREKSFLAGNICMSTHQMQLIFAFFSARTIELAKEKGDKNHPKVIEFAEVKSGILKAFYARLVVGYFKMLTCLSNPTQKYYW